MGRKGGSEDCCRQLMVKYRFSSITSRNFGHGVFNSFQVVGTKVS